MVAPALLVATGLHAEPVGPVTIADDAWWDEGKAVATVTTVMAAAAVAAAATAVGRDQWLPKRCGRRCGNAR